MARQSISVRFRPRARSWLHSLPWEWEFGILDRWDSAKPNPAGGPAMHPTDGRHCACPCENPVRGILCCIFILIELAAGRADKSAGRRLKVCTAQPDWMIVSIPDILLLLGNIQGYSEVICNPPFWSGEPQPGYFLHQGVREIKPCGTSNQQTRIVEGESPLRRSKAGGRNRLPTCPAVLDSR